ncbi:hypothetical protein SE17_15440 [Kouleothrix aurantiaca]|uniref:Uncharacterized protein n=1 Tax=Kouleothrix aurantiaca TaxID=186479 RepID=A0A0P9DGI0_9CHLR|nr:hypothetical protein SE17_15440 [Kouleothrix aurantiaca]
MDDLEHFYKMRAGYQSRINLLKQRRALRGELPTAEAMELAQAERDLEILEADSRLLAPSPELVLQLGPDARLAVVEQQGKFILQKVDSALRTIDRQLAQIRDDSAEYRAAERQERHERQQQLERERQEEKRQRELEKQQEKRERMLEQRFIWTVLAMIIIAVLVLAFR